MTDIFIAWISHAAYVAGKMPNQSGWPRGLSVGNRAAVASDEAPPGFAPRNAPKA